MPVQVDIGLAMFKRELVMKADATLLANTPNAFQVRLDKSLAVNFAVLLVDEKNRQYTDHEWCVYLTTDKGGKRCDEVLVAGFPATATVDDFKDFCLRSMRQQIASVMRPKDISKYLKKVADKKIYRGKSVNKYDKQHVPFVIKTPVH